MMKPQQRKKFGPTQKDIADSLGLAQSTVATALNPQMEHKLFDETVKLIREQAEKMGYRPQRFAQIMQGKRSRTVGLATPTGSYPVVEEAVVSLTNVLHRSGYHVVRVDIAGFGGDAEAIKNYFLDQSAECVILCNVDTCFDEAFVQAFSQRSIPVVSFRAAFDKNIFAVRHDIGSAFYHLTKHHLSLGSKNLTLSLMHRESGDLGRAGWSDRQRAEGFAQAINEAGGRVITDPAVAEILELTPRKNTGTSVVGKISYPVKTTNVTDAYGLGYQQTRMLIESESLPESLVCANDDIAIGASAACFDAGINIPERVRVSGCDNGLPGQYCAVPITSVRQPNDAMVEMVASIVTKLLEKASLPKAAKVYTFPCDIVIRQSTASRLSMEKIASKGLQMGEPNGTRIEWFPEEGRRSMSDRSPVDDALPSARS